MKLYLLLLIFFFSCAEHDDGRVKRGVLFVSGHGGESLFSALNMDILSMELVRKDGVSVRKLINKKLDWAFPYEQFLTGLSVEEGEYERIRILIGFAETSALIYGATDTGEVFPGSWLDAQLVDINGRLIPQELDRQLIDISLNKPLIISSSVPQFLSFTLSLDDSFTPVSTETFNGLLFLPVIDALIPVGMRLRGVVEHYKNNQVAVSVGEALINIDSPSWLVNSVPVVGQGTPTEIKGANIEAEVAVDSKGQVSYQVVDLISQERYIGQMLPNKVGVSFSGHGVPVGGQASFVKRILFPGEGEIKEGIFNMQSLAPGQALSFVVDNDSGELNASGLVLLSNDLVAQIVRVDEEQLELRPMSIDKKLGGAFYQKNISTDNKYAGAVKKNDIVRFTGIFKGEEDVRFEAIEYQVLEREKDSSFEKKLSLTCVFDRKYAVSLSTLINGGSDISLRILSGKVHVYAAETTSSVLVSADVDDIDTSSVDIYKIIMEDNLRIIEEEFHSFERLKSYIFSIDRRYLMVQAVFKGGYVDSKFQAESIILYVRAVAHEEMISTPIALEEESSVDLSQDAVSANATDSSAAINMISSSLIGLSIVGVAALGAKIYFDNRVKGEENPGVVGSEPINNTQSDSDYSAGGDGGTGASVMPAPNEKKGVGGQQAGVEAIKPVSSFTVSSTVGVERDVLTALKVDENGDSFYVKPKERALAMDEKLTSELYKIAGVNVVEHEVKKLSLDEKRQLETSKEYAVYTKYEGDPVSDLESSVDGGSIFQSKLFDLVVADLWLGNSDMSNLGRKLVLDKNNSTVKVLGFESDLFRSPEGRFNLALHQEDFLNNLSSHATKISDFNASKSIASLQRLNAMSSVDIKNSVNQYFSADDKMKSYLSDLLIFRKVSLLLSSNVVRKDVQKEDAAVYFMHRYGKKIHSSIDKFTDAEIEVYDANNKFIRSYIENRKETDLDNMKIFYGEDFLLRVFEMHNFQKEIIYVNLADWIKNKKININHVSSGRMRIALDRAGDEEKKSAITDYFVSKYGDNFKSMLNVFSLDDVKLFNDFEEYIYGRFPDMGDSKIIGKKAAIKKYILNKYKSTPWLIKHYLSQREEEVLKLNGIKISSLINTSGSLPAVDNLSINVGEQYLYVYSDVEPKDVFRFGFSVSGEYQKGRALDVGYQGEVFFPRFSHDVQNYNKGYVYLVRKPKDLEQISVVDFKSYGDDSEAVRYFLKPIKKEDIIAATRDIITLKENAAPINQRFYEADWYNNPAYKTSNAAYKKRK